MAPVGARAAIRVRCPSFPKAVTSLLPARTFDASKEVYPWVRAVIS